jgi:hypothetical protein
VAGIMNEQTYKIRVNLSNKEIEVEGDKEFVREEIRVLLKEISRTSFEHTIPEEPSDVDISEEQTSEEKPYIKDFINWKNPNGAIQTAVALAYYLYKYEDKETFNKEDIKKLWIASGQKPPKKIWQAVIDGKNRHQWYEEVSRGVYKISPHGIYFVENELPKKKE